MVSCVVGLTIGSLISYINVIYSMIEPWGPEIVEVGQELRDRPGAMN